MGEQAVANLQVDCRTSFALLALGPGGWYNEASEAFFPPTHSPYYY